jgi:hypothetical protein
MSVPVVIDYLTGTTANLSAIVLTADAYSRGERLARISEIGGPGGGTAEASANALAQSFTITCAASANAYVQSLAVTVEASANIMNFVENRPTGSVTYSQISYDAADLSNTITPSGNFNLLVITNCANPLTFGTPVNMSNGQAVKIILEVPSPGSSSLNVTLPTSGYSSITQALFDSLWISTGPKPFAAMFEYTKMNTLSGKVCSVNYISLEAL